MPSLEAGVGNMSRYIKRHHISRAALSVVDAGNSGAVLRCGRGSAPADRCRFRWGQ